MDQSLLLLLNKTLATSWLDVFFAWVSQSDSFSIPLLLLVMVFWVWRFGKVGLLFWLLSIALIVAGDQFGALLKQLFAQPRPCAELGEAVRQVDTLFRVNCSRNFNGMPSNHALNFFLFATFTSYVLPWRSWRVSFVVLATLVALSRVYLGVHYPSQILAGTLIGVSLGLGAGWLCARYLPLVQQITRMAAGERRLIP